MSISSVSNFQFLISIFQFPISSFQFPLFFQSLDSSHALPIRTPATNTTTPPTTTWNAADKNGVSM